MKNSIVVAKVLSKEETLCRKDVPLFEIRAEINNIKLSLCNKQQTLPVSRGVRSSVTTRLKSEFQPFCCLIKACL